MKTNYLWTSILVALALGTVLARADLNIRVSVKLILDDFGNPPSNFTANWDTQSVGLTNVQSVSNNINYINTLLAGMGRGYQFKLTEVLNVSGLSRFFNVSARNQTNRDNLDHAVTETETARTLYFWRDNAINVYINNTISGICSFPPGRDLVFLGSDAYDTLIIHEIGHYLDLFHTHEGENGCTDPGEACDCGETLVGGDNDRVTDTVSDHECWTLSQLASNNPGASVTELNNVWSNIMSYHAPDATLSILTSDQLDRWADEANGSRNHVVNGKTIFVDTAADDIQDGTSTSPLRTVTLGVAGVSDPDDIVLLRSGDYVETTLGAASLVISKALTLRASRGNATITIP